MIPSNDNERPGRKALVMAWHTFWAFWHMDKAADRLDRLGERRLASEIRDVLQRTPLPNTKTNRRN